MPRLFDQDSSAAPSDSHENALEFLNFLGVAPQDLLQKALLRNQVSQGIYLDGLTVLTQGLQSKQISAEKFSKDLSSLEKKLVSNQITVEAINKALTSLEKTIHSYIGSRASGAEVSPLVDPDFLQLFSSLHDLDVTCPNGAYAAKIIIGKHKLECSVSESAITPGVPPIDYLVPKAKAEIKTFLEREIALFCTNPEIKLALTPRP